MNAVVSLNADMAVRVVVDTAAMAWQPSRSPSVWRKRLHGDGPSEAARVTSIVRFDRGGTFPAHDHPGGEEILVLDGVFSDEHGDYPAGSHILNPEGSRHAPFSREGCTLFVKLRQYAGADRPQQWLDPRGLGWETRRGGQIAELPLYRQEGHAGRTSLIRFAAGARAPRHGHPYGEEVLILEGTLEDELGTYGPGCWIRNPVGSQHQPFSRAGCLFFLKTGSVI